MESSDCHETTPNTRKLNIPYDEIVHGNKNAQIDDPNDGAPGTIAHVCVVLFSRPNWANKRKNPTTEQADKQTIKQTTQTNENTN